MTRRHVVNHPQRDNFEAITTCKTQSMWCHCQRKVHHVCYRVEGFRKRQQQFDCLVPQKRLTGNTF